MLLKTKMERPYFPTDIPRNEFEKARWILDGTRKTTRPKIHNSYDIFCGILFILNNKLPWRSLPKSFPPWRSVHHHFTQWTVTFESHSPLEKMLEQVGLYETSMIVRGLITKRPLPPI